MTADWFFENWELASRDKTIQNIYNVLFRDVVYFLFRVSSKNTYTWTILDISIVMYVLVICENLWCEMFLQMGKNKFFQLLLKVSKFKLVFPNCILSTVAGLRNLCSDLLLFE